MSTSQPAPAAAQNTTNQNIDTKKQNEKIFNLFLKKLASLNVTVYIEACRKLSQWLDDTRAYYPEALPWILKLLLRAQKNLSDQAGVAEKNPFHLSLAANNPLAPGYVTLVRTVEKYRSQFVNTQFLEPLDTFCRSIDERFAVKDAQSPSVPQQSAPHANQTDLNAVINQPPNTDSNITPRAPPMVNTAAKAELPPKPTAGQSETSKVVQGPQTTSITKPTSPPKTRPSHTNILVQNPQSNTTVGFTPGVQSTLVKPKSPPKAAHQANAAPALVPKPAGVKLRRRHVPRADILDADDEDARRRLEAGKWPGIEKRGSTLMPAVEVKLSTPTTNNGNDGTTKSPSISASISTTTVVDQTPTRTLVKAETTDDRTPTLSQGSGPGSRLTTPLPAALDAEQRRTTPPVSLKTEPTSSTTISIQNHDPNSIPPQSRSPQPAPPVESTLGDGGRQESQSIPPERVERAESTPTPQVEEQPDSTENKLAATEVQAPPDLLEGEASKSTLSEGPILSELSEELQQPPSIEAEAAAAAEGPKVAGSERSKSPLSVTESRRSLSLPLALQSRPSQPVSPRPSSPLVSVDLDGRGESSTHEDAQPDAVPLAIDPAPSIISPGTLRATTPLPEDAPRTESPPPAERRSQSVAGSHASLPMSPSFLESQMEVVVESSTAPIQQKSQSPSASHPSLPMSPSFLESQMDVVADADEGATVMTEPISGDKPSLQPNDLSDEARSPVRLDAPDGASNVPASVDLDVPSPAQPIDEMTNASDNAGQASISREDAGDSDAVQEVVSRQEPLQNDDGPSMDVDLLEDLLEGSLGIGEPANVVLPEPDTQSMDVDASEVDASEGVTSATVEDDGSVDGGNLDALVITAAPSLNPTVEEEVRFHPIDIPTNTSTLNANQEDNATPSGSTSERALSPPDATQEVPRVDDYQAQDIPAEPAVQDDLVTSTSTSSTHASQPSSGSPQGDLPELSRDNQGTPVNETNHTSQPYLDPTNDALSAQSPLNSSTPVNESIPLPAVEHDINTSEDLGLPIRQETPPQPPSTNVVDVAGEDEKDDNGDAVDVRTSVEPFSVPIDESADTPVSVPYSDKAALDEMSISILVDLHQADSGVPSDIHLNSTENSTEGMEATNDIPSQAMDRPTSELAPVSDDHVVQPMFRPGVTILAIFQGNDENAKATTRFVMQNKIEMLLAQWKCRYKTQKDIINSVSVSLACYRSKDMAGTLSVVGASPDAASEFVNSCPQTWPTDGSLSFGMFYNEKRQSIPLAPPLLPTHNRFLDVSQFVHEGDNTFELEFGPPSKIYTCILFAHHPTHTQLADVAARRESKELWKQQLATCFRPLEIPTFVF